MRGATTPNNQDRLKLLPYGSAVSLVDRVGQPPAEALCCGMVRISGRPYSFKNIYF